VIRENGTITYHYAVLNSHARADVAEGTDFHQVAYSYIVPDMGLIAHNAMVSELRPMPDVHIVPNGRTCAELNTVLDYCR
jgi:hypothetical protein